MKTKDTERRAYKEKHGIMTQEERENMMKNAAKAGAATTSTSALKL